MDNKKIAKELLRLAKNMTGANNDDATKQINLFKLIKENTSEVNRTYDRFWKALNSLLDQLDKPINKETKQTIKNVCYKVQEKITAMENVLGNINNRIEDVKFVVDHIED